MSGNSRSVLSLALVFVWAAFCLPAEAMRINWATTESGSGLGANALLEPGNDAAPTTVSVTYGSFGGSGSPPESVIYGSAALAGAFGIGIGDLNIVDFVLFDGNSNLFTGVEDAKMDFTDGVNSVTINHVNLLAQSGVFSEGNISKFDYNNLFGASLPLATPTAVGFLLLDLTALGIDVDAAGFTAAIVGADPTLPGLKVPDLHGLGVIAAVPEPSSVALFAIGLAAVLVVATRRR